MEHTVEIQTNRKYVINSVNPSQNKNKNSKVCVHTYVKDASRPRVCVGMLFEETLAGDINQAIQAYG